MLKTLPTIASAILAIASLCRAQTTQPVTQPIVSTCYIGDGTSQDNGQNLPRVYQVQPNWWDAHIAGAKKIDAAVMVDYEPESFDALYLRTPQQIATSRAKAVVDIVDVWAAESRSLVAQAREQLPTRRIMLFSHFPLGQRWQYGEDQTPWVAANKRLIKSGGYDNADAIAFHAYLDQSDRFWMTPEAAADFTAKRIAAAKAAAPEDKPLVVVLSHVWIGSTLPIPEPILLAQYRVIADAGCELLWWDGKATKVQARAFGLQAAGIRKKAA